MQSERSRRILIGRAFHNEETAKNIYQKYNEKIKEEILIKAICELQSQGKAVDVVSVGNLLIDKGEFDFIGGAGYLSKLALDTDGKEMLDKQTKPIDEKSQDEHRTITKNYDVEMKNISNSIIIIGENNIINDVTAKKTFKEKGV